MDISSSSTKASESLSCSSSSSVPLPPTVLHEQTAGEKNNNIEHIPNTAMAEQKQDIDDHEYDPPDDLLNAAAELQEKQYIQPMITPELIEIFGENWLKIDFNERFQTLYEEAVFTPYEIAQAQQGRDELYEDFDFMAERVVRKLIEQLKQPTEQWIIKPLHGAGVAGGEKFVVGHLFCKFARDDKKLYGGDDEMAAKMAKNEIRHTNALLRLRINQLHTSMSAAYTMQGHTVIVTALMPIHNGTLVYGSSDASRTVHDRSDEMRGMIDRIGDLFNLQLHGVRSHPQCRMHLGVDCEGHQSRKDGRCYVVDLGRAMPPNNEHFPESLIQVFRPEYMLQRARDGKAPLSADAFSGFGLPEDNAVVREACREDFESWIPKVANELDVKDMKEEEEDGKFSLSSFLHERGVNLRHLAMIRKCCSSDVWQQRLLEEMAYRALKSWTRVEQRQYCLTNSRACPEKQLVVQMREKYPDWPGDGIESLKEGLSPRPLDWQGWSCDECACDLQNAVRYKCSVCPDYDLCDSCLRKNLHGNEHELVSMGIIHHRAIMTTQEIQVTKVVPPKFFSLEEAEKQYLEELQLREKMVGPYNAALYPTLFTLLKLYKVWHELSAEHSKQKAEKVIEQLLHKNGDGKENASVLKIAATFFQDVGEYLKAEPLYERALQIDETKLGVDHPDTASGVNNLAEFFRSQGKYAKAEPLFERALQICETKLGADHPDTARILNNLAELHRAQGQYAKAEPLYERALQIYETKLGVDHPDTARISNNLALLYKAQCLYAQAEPLFERALKIHETKLGVDHPDTATILNNLAEVHRAEGQYAKAEALYQRALQICETKLGADHPDSARILNNLAALYRVQGQYAKAEPLYKQSLEICERKLGADHPGTATSLNNLAASYQAQRQYAKAEPLYERALQIYETKLGVDHPDTATSLNNLAALYDAQAKYTKAEPLYQRALQIRETKLGADHPDTAASLNNLAASYHAQGQYAKAEPLYERALQICMRKFGVDHFQTLNIAKNFAQLRSSR